MKMFHRAEALSNSAMQVATSKPERALIRRSLCALGIGVISMLIADVALAAGRVFYDGFESGTGQWSKDDFRDMCVSVATSVDAVPPKSGARMLECNWNGTVVWNATNSFSTLQLNSWNYTSEFLIRFWVRLSADVDRKQGSKLFRMSPISTVADDFFLNAQMENAGGPLLSYWATINGSAGPIFWGDSSPLGDGQWHKIEIYVKHNTPGVADGTQRIWLDGSLKQQGTNMVTISPGDHWYPIHLMSNWSNNPGWEHDANNHVYWDEFEIYSDNGSGGVGNMFDASISTGGPTTAGTPANVRIVP